MGKKKREKNSFDITVESFKKQGADTLYLSHFDKKHGVVTGEAMNSKTGVSWAMAVISSIEEAIKCKYPLACASEDKELITYLEKHRKG